MHTADAASARTRSGAAGVIAAVGVGAIVLVGWRWWVLAAHGEPVGVDTGHWVALGDHLLGGPERTGGVMYPPLVPLLARALVAVAGMPTTTSMLAAIGGAAPAVGLWAAARRSLGDVIAGTAGLVVGLGAATSAAAAWGGVPQLLAIGLAPPSLVALTTVVARPRARNAVVAALLLLAVGATSPLAFALVLAASVVSVAAASIAAGTWTWVRWLPVLLAPLVVLAPLYAHFLRGSVDVGIERRGALSAAFVSGVVAWVVLLILAVVAPFVTRAHRRDPLWAASLGMTVVAVASLAARDTRATALVPTAAALGAATLVRWAPSGARLAAQLVAGGAALVIVFVGPSAMAQERDRYATFVPHGTGAAVDWLRRHAARDDLVAVAPVRGAPFGWVVAGWAQRPVLVGSDPRWLRFSGERADARAVTAIFTAQHWPGAAALRDARAHGVAWLYVPSSWGGVDARALAALEHSHPGVIRYRGPGGLLIVVPREAETSR
jgi:hypothetical protein